jgi:hypothetical protein
MNPESHGEHAGTEAYVVVDPVGRVAVLVQPWDMSAYPDANVSERIKSSRLWIWSVFINRRCPINGDATQDKAQKNGDVQPVAAPHEQVVPANYTHAGLRFRRGCSNSLVIDLYGM